MLRGVVDAVVHAVVDGLRNGPDSESLHTALVSAEDLNRAIRIMRISFLALYLHTPGYTVAQALGEEPLATPLGDTPIFTGSIPTNDLQSAFMVVVGAMQWLSEKHPDEVHEHFDDTVLYHLKAVSQA